MKHNYSSSLRRAISAVVLLLVSTLSWAYDFKVGGIYYDFHYDGVTVTSGPEKYSGHIAVPSTVVHEGNTYGVTHIDGSAFRNCTSLTSISLPENLKSIEKYAFLNCTSLTSISLHEGVTYIGIEAFRNCTSLTSIDIPEGVTYIGTWTFYGCFSLTTVIYRAEQVPDTSNVFDNTFDNTPIDKATLYVPAASIETYKATAPWSRFGTILPLEDYQTGIDTPSAMQPDEAADTAAPYYTPGGQRVNAPVRGHIYIRSGRKVIY